MKKIKSLLYYLFVYPYYKIQFKQLGSMCRIVNPLKIEGYERISVGSNVIIQYKTWLAALPLTGLDDCKLTIGDSCRIGNFNHIFATSEISIGNSVLTADKVFISDNLHSYGDVRMPITDQPIKQLKSVSIGNGSWLGENVCVLGSSIGKGCVIGANSVVTKDIPDYCVAVGAPASIIKRYSVDKNEWLKTDKDGNFI